MIWVSYSISQDGFRHQLIEASRRARVRFFISEYILDELESTLVTDFQRTPRYARLARSAIQRFAKTVRLALSRRGWVIGDPDDDPIIHTALLAKADYLLTADKNVLALGQIEDLRIIREKDFAALIGARL